MHLHHEGLMIRVQCHRWFVEDTLEHLRMHYKFFMVNGSVWKLIFKSNFAHLSYFSCDFKGHKWVRRLNIISIVNLNMVYLIPMWKLENFHLEAHRSKNMYFLGPKVKITISDGTPHLQINPNIYDYRKVQRS